MCHSVLVKRRVPAWARGVMWRWLVSHKSCTAFCDEVYRLDIRQIVLEYTNQLRKNEKQFSTECCTTVHLLYLAVDVTLPQYVNDGSILLLYCKQRASVFSYNRIASIPKQSRRKNCPKCQCVIQDESLKRSHGTVLETLQMATAALCRSLP